MWLTLLALRNAIAVLMASLGIAILGFVALGRLPVDLFPNINLPIINIGTTAEGRPVLLSTLAEIKASSGSAEIERKYQQRLVRVAANAVGRDLGSIWADLAAQFRQLSLPAGFSLRLGGQTELLVSTFFTLVLIPTLYVTFEERFPRRLDDGA